MSPSKNAVLAAILVVLYSTDVAMSVEHTLILQDREGGYAGTRDTQLAKGYNLGGWTQFGIWQFDEPALISFDLSGIPKSAQVKAATLELSFLSCGFAPDEIRRKWPVEVYQCEQPWKEGTGTDAARTQNGANIQTYNGQDAWPEGKVTFSSSKRLGRTVIAGGQKQRWYKWKLNTARVQEWINGDQKNHGMVIDGRPPGKAVAFVSRENPDPARRPILRLTLSLPQSDLPRLFEIAPSVFQWEEFVRDCGLAAQKANQARTEQVFRDKYKDEVITWTGTVYFVAEAELGSGYFVDVSMNPTESRIDASDITLFAAGSFRNAVVSLNKGDKIQFTGRLISQGGVILNHQIELMWVVKR